MQLLLVDIHPPPRRCVRPLLWRALFPPLPHCFTCLPRTTHLEPHIGPRPILLIHMRLLSALVCGLALLSAAVVAQDKPMNLPCVTWEPLTYQQNTDPTDLFVAAYTWVITDSFGDCLYKGDVFPCFSSDPGSNTWGHHDYQASMIPNDYCRSYLNGSVYFSNNMYVPKKGPKWQTWKWKQAQTGGVVPSNAIRFGEIGRAHV